MTLHLTVTPQLHTDFTPRITVIGVGGGGTNAVNNMITSNLQGVEFIVANTDAQSLIASKAERRIQLGPHITQGLGAGAKPEIGRAAAEEAADEIYRHLEGAHMVFITAGMGGGTGTGAAPVIARMARERGILTVGVVTKPFAFEGSRRAKEADRGIAELVPHVDTLIVIPNQNLFLLANERTGWKEAFKMADHVLYMGVRGVTDLMVVPGMINLDFADIRTVMAEMGKAMMGTGEMEGDNRATRAAEAAINNPLLENSSMAGARGLLVNITGGEDMTLFEVNDAMDRIRGEVDDDANIIFGTAVDENLAGRIRVSVVATGIDTQARIAAPVLQVVNGGAIGGEDDAVAQAEAPAAQGPARPSALNTAAPAGVAPLRPAPPPPLPPGLGRTGAAPVARAVEEPAMAGQLRERDVARDYEPISDDQPAAPRRIPEHLQRPVGSARPVAGYQSPLFHGREATATPAPAPAPAGRKSLFSKVTGAIQRGLPQAVQHGHHTAVPVVRTASVASEPGQAELAAEPMAETLRQSGSDDKIEIPTFLRRQSS